MQAWLPWPAMTPMIKLYSALWYCEYQIISVGLARQACAVADNYKDGIYARCNNISESRTRRLYKWNNRGQNNNQTLHQLTKWRIKYHRFLQGGTTKNGILGNQLHFTHPKRTTFRDDFEGFNRNLRMQSLPEMNGVPGVSTFSFTLFQSPGEKQANIRITFQRNKNFRVSWDWYSKEMFSSLCFQKGFYVWTCVTFQEAVPWGNMTCSNSELEKILYS